MRWRKVAVLAKMLLRFFARRVLDIGPLRSRGVRILTLALAAALYAITTGLLLVFLRSLDMNSRTWTFLLDAQTISVIMWTLVVFIFVKTLFLNASGLLELTVQLPLTNRERAAGFLLYEIAMTAVAIGAITSAFATAAMIGMGLPAGIALLESIVIPVAVVYAAATIVFDLFGRLLSRVGLGRVRDAVSLIAMFALVAAYTATMSRSIQTLGPGYIEGTDPLVWQTALAWWSRRAGSVIALLGGAVVLGGLTAMAIRFAPQRRPSASRYLAVLTGAAAGRGIAPYDMAFLRSTQTTLGLSVSLATFVALLTTGAASPLWSLSLLSMGCLYHYAAIMSLHINGRRPSPGSVYLRLLKAPLLLVGTCAVPEIAIAVVAGGSSVRGVISPIAGAIAAVLAFVCIGIVFPAEGDNPFSVFVGMSLLLVLVGLIGIGVGVLDLPAAANAAVIAVIIAMLVIYSVQGIVSTETRSRHEKVGRDSKRSARRGDPHGHRERRGPAVLDVLD